MKLDNRRRQTHARVDSLARQFKIRLAREFIYQRGFGVKSAAVERLLEADSSVPTENAFSILLKFAFNFFAMLAPDFMHEFELGVWKAILIHLIRILFAYGNNTPSALNRRYRQVPTFGRSTIRRFSDNVIGLKKLAARNYEDLLQCAIPVFDDLLEGEDNDAVISLLFTLAEWHALGKLCLHTETTLQWLDQCTTDLGQRLRKFESETCSHYDTRELPKEAQARVRHQTRNAATAQQEVPSTSTPATSTRGRGRGRASRGRGRGRGASANTSLDSPADEISNTTTLPSPVPSASAQPIPTAASTSAQPATLTPINQPSSSAGNKKKLNLHLIKLHALGDYVSFIRRFGTSDSYSTQPGELEHRMVKRFYARTNKNQAVVQMTRLERRNQALLRQTRALAKQQATSTHTSTNSTSTTPKRRPKPRGLTVTFQESEPLPATPPEYHHHISSSRNFPMHLQKFILDHKDDPAVTGFYSKLQDHILGRLLHPDWSGGPDEFSTTDRAQVIFFNNRFYRHKVMRVNYTGYDVRRGQDSINSRNHADIMTLAAEEDLDHPFRYAQVIGIFHVDVILNAPGQSQTPVSKEVLWVRWFKYDKSYRAGFQQRRLHCIHFTPSEEPDAFGFLDPDEVIRGAHLIPAFQHGATAEWLTGSSIAREDGEEDDWKYFFVNIFVDRDMYMRYAGGGVGHYRLPLSDPHIPVSELNPEPDTGEDPSAPAPAPEAMSPEQLRQQAEEAGDKIADTQDHSDDEEHADELTLDDEDEVDVVGSSADEEDVGAEDGEDGAGDMEDEQGYADL
ncbi:hypothetical protein H0H81_012646 [Sphagnurus paluster]|uniref:Uncharacterized protein n=1 Tax=Sphagnurus paluster TaxID=117069 RepID=A0A9P7K6S7_9AGAR|nr:hypothetical protein H0H81_012646 [Sphagnurus paluster]